MTVLDALVKRGFPKHVARRDLRYGRVRVDGLSVTNPYFQLRDGQTVEVRLQ